MTLIEVMLAIAVLAIALMALLSLWAASERLGSVAREDAIAQAAVNQIVSDIRATPFHLLSDMNYGFSNGYYDGTGTSQRLRPKYFSSSRAWDSNSPLAIALDTLPSGITASLTPFTDSIPMLARDDGQTIYWGPSGIKPELRTIIINDECPIESQLGEDNGDGDSLDLDRDGTVATTPVPPSPFPATPVYSAVMGCSVTPLFPMLLAGYVHMPSHSYLNIAKLQMVPIVVQIRWWSKAGIPREITVVTMVSNRNGVAGQ